MSAKRKAKNAGGMASWPLWARILVPFMVMLAVAIAVQFFKAVQGRAGEAEVARIAAQGEARRSLDRAGARGDDLNEALGAANNVDRSTDDSVTSRGAIDRATSSDLVGIWDEEDQTITQDFGTMRFSEGVSIYGQDGTYRTSAQLTLRTKDGLEVDGTYQISISGRYSVKQGRFYTTPLQSSAQPQFPANATAEKRSAMSRMAEEFRDPGEPDSDQIVELTPGRFVIRTEMSDGQLIETVSRKRRP